MSKGTISDIKPGMLIQFEVSSGPDKGIVYSADTDIFNVLILDNSGENLPARIGADEIVCAWNISQLPTYVVGDILINGEHNSFRSSIEKFIVYGNFKAEKLEMTLEEISELISKHIGKSVSVSVKDPKPEGVESKTEVFVEPEDGVIARDAQIGEEFEIKGVRYRVIEDTRASKGSCDGCALKADCRCCYYTGLCGYTRRDGKPILFERVSTESDCNSSEAADMCKGQKPTIAAEIHDLYEVEPAIGYIFEDGGRG